VFHLHNRSAKAFAGASRRRPSTPGPRERRRHVVEALEFRRLLATVAAPAVDDPDPAVQVADRLVAEGAGQVVFEITVPAGDAPVTLDYSSAPGTATAGLDYASVGGTLTFAPDPSPRTQTVAVPVVDDAFWEDGEWFYLTLSNVSGAPLPGGFPTYRATATIRDDDPRPALRVSDVRVGEGDSGDAAAAFVVSMSAALDRPVTVEYATADGTAGAASDYAAAGGTLTFEPGETAKSVAVPVHGDTADESNETFTLNLRSPTLATIADGQGVGTIVEDDDRPPTANVSDVSPDPRSEAVDGIAVVFSEPVDGVDVSDFTLTRDGGPNLLTPEQTPTPGADGATWTLGNLDALTRPAGRYTLTLGAAGSGIADRGGNDLRAGASDSWRVFATVSDRRVFYNNSSFDGNDTAANGADDNALAPDKRALRPGESAAFANVTGYSRGINGLMIDVAGLPAGAAPGPGDFTFGVGNGSPAAAWADAPAPTSVAVRRGAGFHGSGRVTVIFPDGAIRNAWLRVTVLATDRTGLAAPDVFYFGNLVGDAGDAQATGSGGGARSIAVDAADLFATRRGIATPGSAAPANVADHNRDGRVNALDLVLVRANLFRTLAPPASAASLAAAVRATPSLLRPDEGAAFFA
jgi:hypothetical protein